MKIGYARVSTEDQKVDLQISALKSAGCTRIFTDHAISGTRMVRPGLDAALRSLKPGQTLVVWRLDRLGRSLLGLVQLINSLGAQGIEFHSLNESIDTASNGGRLIFHIMAALAEFERSLISDRTRAGLAEAKRRGNQLGRPRLLSDKQIEQARFDILNSKKSAKEIASELGVSEKTIARYTGTNSTQLEKVGM